MPMPAQEIKQAIQNAIPGCEVQIKALRDDNDHYMAYVTSPTFKGKTRIQQHRMVYEALKGRVGKQLHALSLQTSVPLE
jgi:stress-induced morphogen